MTAPKTGVYVCHCGTNIAAMVDVEEVRDWAASELADRGGVVARDYPFMCSSLGQELIERDISELGLERVVVAAWTRGSRERLANLLREHGFTLGRLQPGAQGFGNFAGTVRLGGATLLMPLATP